MISMELTVEKAEEYLAWHLKVYHHLTLDDVEVTDSRGYWRRVELCDENCTHPIHTCLGCEDRVHHTISFTEHGVRNEKGQFVSPFRVWKILHENRELEG